MGSDDERRSQLVLFVQLISVGPFSPKVLLYYQNHLFGKGSLVAMISFAFCSFVLAIFELRTQLSSLPLLFIPGLSWSAQRVQKNFFLTSLPCSVVPSIVHSPSYLYKILSGVRRLYSKGKLLPSIIAAFLAPRLVLIDIACQSVTLCHDRALRPLYCFVILTMKAGEVLKIFRLRDRANEKEAFFLSYFTPLPSSLFLRSRP